MRRFGSLWGRGGGGGEGGGGGGRWRGRWSGRLSFLARDERRHDKGCKQRTHEVLASHGPPIESERLPGPAWFPRHARGLRRRRTPVRNSSCGLSGLPPE